VAFCSLKLHRAGRQASILRLYEDNKERLSAEKWCMEIAEEALIEVLRPCINISKNRKTATPLPKKYRDPTPVNKGIHFE
jgi:hypothetical protein